MTRALCIASVQPDVFCHGDPRNNIGGPHCAKCGRGIWSCPDQTLALRWCIFCGFESGALPLVELPISCTTWNFAVTFDEALIMRRPDFDPYRDLRGRKT
jgi:hypothetical protein